MITEVITSHLNLQVFYNSLNKLCSFMALVADLRLTYYLFN